jgi:hypothetical protein
MEIPLVIPYQNARYFVIRPYLITIILLICSAVIIKQLHYILDHDVEPEKENVILLPVDFPQQKVMTLKDRILLSVQKYPGGCILWQDW